MATCDAAAIDPHARGRCAWGLVASTWIIVPPPVAGLVAGGLACGVWPAEPAPRWKAMFAPRGETVAVEDSSPSRKPLTMETVSLDGCSREPLDVRKESNKISLAPLPCPNGVCSDVYCISVLFFNNS